MNSGDHLCLCFDSDREQGGVVAAFVREGIASHHKVLYLADKAPDRVLASLRTRGLDPTPHLASGQLAVSSTQETYLQRVPFEPEHMIDTLSAEADLALEGGYRALSVTGEMSWALRGYPGSDRVVEFESRVASVFAARPVLAVCQYDRRRFPAGQLAALQRVHPGVLADELAYEDTLLRVTRTRLPQGLRLVGEVDLTNVEALRELVREQVQRSRGALHLDLSGLGFIDVRGARLLVHHATTASSHRRLVILESPGPELRLMLASLGWDRITNLVIRGGTSVD
ncbi:MAG: MEDS domain-containing protein [Carbonactinosporaceae bacterium]